MSKKMEKGTENAIFLDGREYTAADLYRLIGLLVGNGIYMNELTPTAANEDMSITHGVGHAWIGGVAYWNTIPFVMDIATADGSLNRYDSLMLRRNLSINEVYAVIEQGAYATNPTPPTVTRTADIFDLKICDIYIPAGCTKITQAQIIDTRLDATVCGVPVFPVEHLDMTTFYKQVTTDLDNLREKERAEIKELLKELNELVEDDTVGQLIAKINAKLSVNGGNMTGAINMNGQALKGLNAPVADDEAVNYGTLKKVARVEKTLTAAGWVPSDTAGFIQSVMVDGLTDEKKCKVYPAIPATLIDKLAQAEETSKIKACTRSGATVTFEAWEEVPAVDITVVVEVFL